MVLIGHVLAVAVAASVHVPPAAAAAPLLREDQPSISRTGPHQAPAAQAAGRHDRPQVPIRLAQVKQPANDGFEPISELPPDERLPAAPMLVAAYAFVAIAIFVYLLSISRRLGALKQEMTRLDAEVKRSGRP